MTKRFEALVERAVDSAELKKHSDGRTLYKAVATTPALDRYGEVVLPKGAILSNFLKNPVLLESHNYAVSSVGHVTDISVEESQVTFEFVFSGDARGAELEAKFIAGDMNAFSIGFRPKAKVDIWAPWDDAPEIKEITVIYPDGSNGVVNLASYEHIPYTVYNQWELLEISPVAVPANPEALLLRQAEDIVRRVAERNPVMKSFVQAQLADQLKPVMDLLAKFTDTFDGDDMKFDGAVAEHSTPGIDETWSGSVARASLAKWASKSETGTKEDMNWSKYSKGFAWFNSEKADSFGAYKLPHHAVKDGALIAIWKGVTAAMAALLGAHGGIDLESKSAVYNHLAKHYQDFGKEAPEMKEYSEEELKAIEAEELTATTEVVIPEGDSTAVKATDPPANEEGTDPEEEAPPTPGTVQMMANMMKLLTQILAALGELRDQEAADSETQEEAFIQWQLRADAIVDLLEYAVNRKALPEPKKKDAEPEVVAEVSADLVANLERINRAL